MANLKIPSSGADSRLAFEITNHPQLTTIDCNSNKEDGILVLLENKSKQYTQASNWVFFPIILLLCVNNEKRRQY